MNENNKKIKVVIATPNSGGPITYSKILFLHLPKMGYEVRIVNFSSVENLPKLVRHVVYFLKLFFEGFKADIIYAQDPVSTGLPALLAAKLIGSRFFLKIVGDYAWEQGVQRFAVKDSLDDFAKKKKYSFMVQLLRYIETFVAKRAEKIIVPSNYLKGIVEKWGIESGKIEVIYNAVSIDEIGRVPEAVKRMSKPLVVTAGRLVPWKGIKPLMKVFEGVWHARLEGSNASLVVVGQGTEEKELKDYAEELNIKNQCLFTGQLSHEDTLAVMKEADIFVLNSTYEGLSHTLIEALKLGLCIIATDAGGNGEIIMNGNGLVIKTGDEKMLASNLKMLIEHQEKRAQFSAIAKESAERFSIEAMLQKLALVLR
ncbi:MAG: glycosyltransferase family 4 protein [Patescibacteria group bacterium]